APRIDHAGALKSLAGDIGRQLAQALSAGRGAAMILDYDGTLREIVHDPNAAAPTAEVARLLNGLAEQKRIRVAIVSGRTRCDLEKFLGHYSFALVAEHGAEFRDEHKRWHQIASAGEWKPRVLEIMRRFEQLAPGSRIETKRTSLVWHFRAADDATDESLFDPPPCEDAVTIKIGGGSTAARHQLSTPAELRGLLEAVLAQLAR